MPRGKSQMHSNRNDNFSNNALDVFGRHDPFREMNQVMRSFGGFGGMSLFNDDFFKDDFMMRPFGDPMERMMDFSDMHQKAHRKGKEGSYVCQTFVSSSTMGPDGKVNTQSYFQNSAGQHKNGKTISQKQQAYKDSNGVKRIAQQRMLNDKGHKVIKEKRGNDVQQTNHYYNIEEDEAPRFHQSWKSVDKELNFIDKYSNHMRGLQNGRSHQPRQLQLGYQHSQYEKNPRVESRQRMEQNNEVSSKGTKKTSIVTPASRGSRKF